MRKSGLLLGCSIALSLMSTVAFADPAQTGAPVASAPVNDPDEIICKVEPAPTGSRLGGGRECHTRHDWDERTKAAQKATQDQEMRGLAGTPGGPGG